MAGPIELYGTSSCPFTAELRGQLEWAGERFQEYDVEADRGALERMIEVTGGQRTVPVLVRNGRVAQIGWQGRGCTVAPPPAPDA